MYVIVWEFIIAVENAGEFEAVYGPDGKWAKLFAASEATFKPGCRTIPPTRLAISPWIFGTRGKRTSSSGASTRGSMRRWTRPASD